MQMVPFAYPENKIAFLSIGALLVSTLEVLSPLVLILCLGVVRKLDLSAAGPADSVEGQTRAVKATLSRSTAISLAKDIFDPELFPGPAINIGASEFAALEAALVELWVGFSFGVYLCLSVSVGSGIGFGVGKIARAVIWSFSPFITVFGSCCIIIGRNTALFKSL